MDLKEIRYEGAEWIQLFQDRGSWKVLSNTVMNLPVPEETKKSLTSSATTGFSNFYLISATHCDVTTDLLQY
jgi:hypothetical protein